MRTVQLIEAQAHLADLVASVASGSDVVITQDQEPVARLTAVGAPPSLAEIQPVSVGAVLRPLGPDDDWLAEMLE
ncbi:MAG TPA: type II toxin-antitoxin system prevent-host-death family antitoxin [Phycisphaerae bacterium]|jgi:prevent-host-death family protein